MTKNNKLALWKSVEQTDPSFVKDVKLGTRKFQSVDPYYRFKEATKAFGSYGIGWMVLKEQWDFDSVPGLCLYAAILKYKQGEEWGEAPIRSSISTHVKRKIWKNGKDTGEYELIPDEDFIKKVATDALTKGLSMLGFSADVFMGKFEDEKYVAMMEKISSEVSDDRLREIEYMLTACETAPAVTDLYYTLEANEKVNKTVLEKFSNRTEELKNGNNS